MSSAWDKLDEAVLTVPKLMETLYIDLAQPLVQKLGQALGTVMEMSNTLLLPVEKWNREKRMTFERNLTRYGNSLERIPSEDITEVPPELGIPILDKLSYVRNENIADLYINLLTTASSTTTQQDSHPAFLQVINSLSADEALIINYLVEKEYVPFISYRSYEHVERPLGKVPIQNYEGFSYRNYDKNLVGLETEISLIFPNNIQLYLDNLVGCRILIIANGLMLSDPTIYERLETLYASERQQHINSLVGFDKTVTQMGYYSVTSFGQVFINACTSGLTTYESNSTRE